MSTKPNQDTRPVYMGTFDKEIKLKNMQISGLKNDVSILNRSYNLVQHKMFVNERKLFLTNIIAIAALSLSVIAILMQLF
jgi:hypothetical protein